MIWSDDTLQTITTNIEQGSSYLQEAIRLSRSYGKTVDKEALRSAVRRFKRRRFIEPVVLPEDVVAPVRVAPAKPQRAFTNVERQITFGAVGDSHLCSNYERLDILESLYEIYHNSGVDTVYHTGNYIDGEAGFNTNDIHARGIDGQCRYFIDNYPSMPGIRTYFIDGDDHEGWYTQKHGIVIGQHVEDLARRNGRDDLVYMGYMEADTTVGEDGPRLRVLHPGGGSSYALSHTSQKIIDSYEDYEKPDILLLGHYHKASYLPAYRGVVIIQTGCTQEPTPFMRKKRLHADLGGWLVTVGLNSDNQIVRANAEFISYPMRPWRHR